MSPSEPWADAWLNNKAMPPHAFPPALLQPLLEGLTEPKGAYQVVGPMLQKAVEASATNDVEQAR
jgi:hypothetical protein